MAHSRNRSLYFSLLLCPLLLWPKPAPAEKLSGRGLVSVKTTPAGFVLLRDNHPFMVRGICGTEKLEIAASLGANSLRTYGVEHARETLSKAESAGLTACLGVWLEHRESAYKDEKYKQRIRHEVRTLVGLAREHPATLLYSIGNEINLGADVPEAWRFVNELAGIAHQLDPRHPVMTVTAGASAELLNRIAENAPALDLLGVNAYGGIVSVPSAFAASVYKGPYLITEWGPLGPWEVAKTAWGAPIEPDSQKKAGFYRRFSKVIASDQKRCLGSYVFLWGQKEERTPTWFGMFLENQPLLGLRGESCPAVDAMAEVWGGKKPQNTAPEISAITVDGRKDFANLTLSPSSVFRLKLAATDPESDPLTYVWEVLAEADRLGQGGSHEDRPRRIDGAHKVIIPGEIEIHVKTPGRYRVYAYALDGKGHAATCNIPFLVQ